MIGIILSITAFLILFILLIYKNRQLKRQLAEAYRELVEDRELIFDLRKYTDEKLIDLESKIRTTAESKKQLMAELEAAQRELSLEGFKMEKQGLSDSIIRLKEQILENNRTIADQEEKINSIPPDYLEQVAAKRKALDEAFEKDKRIKEDELEALKAEVELKKQEADSEIAAIALSLEKARSAQKAIIEENKRREEMAQHRDFYRIQLSDSDKKEIAQLREVEQSLRDPEPLRKVIWSYYYQNAAKDMINRVLGKEPKTGIYKITNIDSGRCYVGQSAEISTRWLSHIKRGLGAEKATKNKLYPEMLKLGPENFTFEIIEECSRADLDAREDYWQEHFGAMEFGYSIK